MPLWISLSERQIYILKVLIRILHQLLVGKYRKIENIEINNLGRVNIFAGGNNSGKTSILELIFLFTRLNTIQALIELEKFRGQHLWQFFD